ncbi:hypothetical protein [Pseudooceanicola sp.]|uniref:hypothetical protein n=1 Tax=Pseudooceanicola sp. TaxID=1914328 RepID=UPI0040588A66
MPRGDGSLSKDEKQKVIDWVNEKGVHHNCPVCGSNNWGVGDHLLSGMPYMGGSIVAGGPSYPAAMLVCNNCAYTRHFMAVKIGLFSAGGSSDGE